MISPPLAVMPVEVGNQTGLALLAQIHRRAFAEQNEAPWSPQSFEKLLVSPGFEASIFCKDKVPIGFALIRSVLDEAELISIAVDPAMQGRGHAKDILNSLLERLREKEIRTFFLEVREDNEKAIQLYRSIGFKKIGERTGYYQTITGKKLDAHVFSLIVE